MKKIYLNTVEEITKALSEGKIQYYHNENLRM